MACESARKSGCCVTYMRHILFLIYIDEICYRAKVFIYKIVFVGGLRYIIFLFLIINDKT